LHFVCNNSTICIFSGSFRQIVVETCFKVAQNEMRRWVIGQSSPKGEFAQFILTFCFIVAVMDFIIAVVTGALKRDITLFGANAIFTSLQVVVFRRDVHTRLVAGNWTTPRWRTATVDYGKFASPSFEMDSWPTSSPGFVA